MIREIPFARPWITDEDRKAVQRVLEGPILTHGPEGKAFEQEFARLAGPGAHAVAVSSCMAALHLSYLRLGIGAGDEVIVPALTHAATAHAPALLGAKPVFADCDPATGNIDPARVEALVTRHTKAISVVHFLGAPCDMDAILAIAQDHGLRVVEDCALALGTRYKGTHAGLLGDVGCFSFYPAKHITTGEGGMVLTRDPELAAGLERLRAFGVQRGPPERTIPGMYDVVELGLNYRMNEMQAALGRGQLVRTAENLRRRRANWQRLERGLAGTGVQVLPAEQQGAQRSDYAMSVLLRGPAARHRDEVARRLSRAGVGTSVYYPHPVPRMTYYREAYGYRAADFPHAEAISDHSIALPVGPHLTVQDMDFIAEALQRALKEVAA